MLGLGTFQSKKDNVYEAILYAIQHGYRLIDTAAVYRNEKDVGRAIRDSGIDRRKLFITSKLGPADQGYQSARDSCLKSMQDLGVDYLDLYLIHWPGSQGLPAASDQNPMKRRESWRALESLYKEGKIRAIGVSNYTIDHLKQLLKHCEVVPAVNQVECHPQLQQRELIEFCKVHGITLQAYASLGQGRLLDNDEVIRIARQQNRAPAQVLLRWALQKHLPIIPKSVQPQRIVENASLFDFYLNEEDITALDRLDSNIHYCWDPTQIP